MTPIFFLIFLLVGLKEACMLNFSFLGCLEVELRILGLTLSGGGTPIFFLIFLLVGLKEASMPNFSFLGCLEVAVLWLEDNKNKKQPSPGYAGVSLSHSPNLNWG